MQRALPILLIAAIAGCRAQPSHQTPHQPAPQPGSADLAAPDQPPARYPFAPASLRIHPLTHVDTRGDKAQVVLHVELLDRYGDSVKGLGKLNVELYKPGAGMTPGIETQALTWEVPGMDDPDQNTRRFDIATRTYRIPLSAPSWVVDAINPAKGPGWLKVRAVLTIQQDGESRYLEDEYVIQG